MTKVRTLARLACAVLMTISVTARPQLPTANVDNDPPRSAEDGGKNCKSEGPGAQYPYRVEDLQRALAITQPDAPATENVKVVVADNGFIGYAKGELSAYRLSDTFPTALFPVKTRGGPYKPGGIDQAMTEDQIDDVVRKAGAADVKPSERLWARKLGHGTHVTGVLLGGFYDAESTPPSREDNTKTPTIRRLLLNGTNGKGWLNVHVVSVSENGMDISNRELAMLAANIKSPKEPFNAPSIVNISLLSDSTRIANDAQLLRLPDDLQTALVVTAAGNAAQLLDESVNDRRYPAMSNTKADNLLVVASHDADMNLSWFSNFGDKYVNLAAPGCGIKSWIARNPEPLALDGTSQAAAMASFGAALMKSQWPLANSNQLRNRLIMGARYSEKLDRCWQRDKLEEAERPPACVRYGSALDIPTSLLIYKDMMEVCADLKQTADLGCRTKVLVGTLTKVPDEISRCPRNISRGEDGQRSHSGLTEPAAVRVTLSGFQVLYIQGIASTDISNQNCESVRSAGAFAFQPEGVQFDSSMGSGEEEYIPASALVRVVTRSVHQSFTSLTDP